jgi:hypothetical protein
MNIKYSKILYQVLFPSPNLNGLKCIKNDIKVHLWSNEPMVPTWGTFFSNDVQKKMMQLIEKHKT